eukprot:m.14348 g.14348  ORF g.14348 m.14348 type:complete len:2596 (-) comp10105_c0_seq1:515-8302(-)
MLAFLIPVLMIVVVGGHPQTQHAERRQQRQDDTVRTTREIVGPISFFMEDHFAESDTDIPSHFKFGEIRDSDDKTYLFEFSETTAHFMTGDMVKLTIVEEQVHSQEEDSTTSEDEGTVGVPAHKLGGKQGKSSTAITNDESDATTTSDKSDSQTTDSDTTYSVKKGSKKSRKLTGPTAKGAGKHPPSKVLVAELLSGGEGRRRQSERHQQRHRRQFSSEFESRAVLVVNVNFATTVPYCDKDCQDMIWWQSLQSLDRVFAESSYGTVRFPSSKFSFDTVQIEGNATDVVDCDVDMVSNAANVILRELHGENVLGGYDHVVYYLPPEITGCGFGGLAQVGGPLVWMRSSSGATAAHEIAHNLGLNHASTDWDDDNLPDAEYGDAADVCGGTSYYATMNAPHRLQLGYLSSNAVFVPDGDGLETWHAPVSEYRGMQSTTVSGRTCQMWTVNTPHYHTYHPENYPDAGLGEHNYCRDPDGWGALWCYTTDEDKSWEECRIEATDVDVGGNNNTDGTCSASFTVALDALSAGFQSPQSPNGEIPASVIKFGRLLGGYYFISFRNDDGAFDRGIPVHEIDTVYIHYQRTTTTNTHLIAYLKPGDDYRSEESGWRVRVGDIECPKKRFINVTIDFCPDTWSDLADPGCQGESLPRAHEQYRGNVSTAACGQVCKKWELTKYIDEEYPGKGLDDGTGNYCRNPDGDRGGPWCYLEDGNWDYCDICGPANEANCPFTPKAVTCSCAPTVDAIGLEYRGDESVSTLGYTCLNWDSAYSTSEGYHPENYPDDDLVDNNCRNIGGTSRQPWCFVNSPRGWDYCSVCPHQDSVSESSPWYDSTPIAPDTFQFCALENSLCMCNGTVRYGAGGRYFFGSADGEIECKNSVFGDPNPGARKQCHCGSFSQAPTSTPTAAPVYTVNITEFLEEGSPCDQLVSSPTIANQTLHVGCNTQLHDYPTIFGLVDDTLRFCLADVEAINGDLVICGLSNESVFPNLARVSGEIWFGAGHRDDNADSVRSVATNTNAMQRQSKAHRHRGPDPKFGITSPDSRPLGSNADSRYMGMKMSKGAKGVAKSDASMYRDDQDQDQQRSNHHSQSAQHPHKLDARQPNSGDERKHRRHQRDVANDHHAQLKHSLDDDSTQRDDGEQLTLRRRQVAEADCGDGSSFRGNWNTTRCGYQCQAWTSQTPHSHDRTPQNYPDKGLGNHNNCRNPDGESLTWCYTTDPDVRWQYCDVCEFNSECVGDSCWFTDLPEFPPVATDFSVPLLNLSITSCFHSNSDASSALETMAENRYQLALELGDNIYSDTKTSCTQQLDYSAKKREAAYGALVQQQPTMATWDDHDFCVNNQGAACGDFRTESQQNFLDFFNVPENDPRRSTQEGVYSANLFGTAEKKDRVHVILLDARFHRSPTFSSYGSCEGSESQMLDEAQWTWLENQLAIPSEVKIIGSGIQVLPPLADVQTTAKTSYCAYDGANGTFEAAIADMDEKGKRGTEYESWSEIPQERAKLLRLVQQSMNAGNAKAVAFVSGDQHWGELSTKTIPASDVYGASQTVHELTASGLGTNWYSTSTYFYNDNRAHVSQCDTRDNGVMNRQCVFPFVYEGTRYTSCTMEGDNVPWCATAVDESDVYIDGEWGVCGSFVNRAPSNYGEIIFDFEEREMSLRIKTPDFEPQTAGAVTVKFGNKPDTHVRPVYAVPTISFDALSRVTNVIVSDFGGALEIEMPLLSRVDGDIVLTNDAKLLSFRAPQLYAIGGNLALADMHMFHALDLGGLEVVRGDVLHKHVPQIVLFEMHMLREVGGDLQIFSNTLKNVTLPKLARILGSMLVERDYYTTDGTALTVLSCPLLEIVQLQLDVNTHVALSEINLPNLVSVGSYLDIWDVDSLSSLVFSKLTSVGGYLFVGVWNHRWDSGSIDQLELPLLKSLGAEFELSAPGPLQTLQLDVLETCDGFYLHNSLVATVLTPSLQTCSGYFELYDNLALSVVRSANLVSIGGSMWVGVYNHAYGTGQIDVVDLSNLKTVDGSIVINDLGPIAELVFPALTTVSSSVEMSNTRGVLRLLMPELVLVDGDLVIYANTDLKYFAVGKLIEIDDAWEMEDNGALEHVYMPKLATVGDVEIKNSALIELSLPSLQTARWDFEVAGCDNLTQIYLPLLSTIADDLYVYDNDNLHTISLPNLETIEDNIFIGQEDHDQGTGRLEVLGLDRVKTVGGGVELEWCGSLRNFSMPSLTDIAGELYIEGDGVQYVHMPELVRVGGYVSVFDTPVLVELDLPLLETCDVFELEEAHAIEELNLPSLTSIANDLKVQACDLVHLVTFPQLTAVGGRVYVYDVNALVAVRFEALETVGTNMYIGQDDNCEVDSVLKHIVLPRLFTVSGYLNIEKTRIEKLSLPDLILVGDYFQTYKNARLGQIYAPLLSPPEGGTWFEDNDVLSTVCVADAHNWVNYSTIEQSGPDPTIISAEQCPPPRSFACGGPQRNYRGTLNKTYNGYTCQAWASQTPNEHSVLPEDYECGGLEQNFCRNADGEPTAWCYTTDGPRWDYCDVCGETTDDTANMFELYHVDVPSRAPSNSPTRSPTENQDPVGQPFTCLLKHGRRVVGERPCDSGP